jgi:hypothetical protein
MMTGEPAGVDSIRLKAFSVKGVLCVFKLKGNIMELLQLIPVEGK